MAAPCDGTLGVAFRLFLRPVDAALGAPPAVPVSRRLISPFVVVPGPDDASVRRDPAGNVDRVRVGAVSEAAYVPVAPPAQVEVGSPHAVVARFTLSAALFPAGFLRLPRNAAGCGPRGTAPTWGGGRTTARSGAKLGAASGRGPTEGDRSSSSGPHTPVRHPFGGAPAGARGEGNRHPGRAGPGVPTPSRSTKRTA